MPVLSFSFFFFFFCHIFSCRHLSHSVAMYREALHIFLFSLIRIFKYYFIAAFLFPFPFSLWFLRFAFVPARVSLPCILKTLKRSNARFFSVPRLTHAYDALILARSLTLSHTFLLFASFLSLSRSLSRMLPLFNPSKSSRNTTANTSLSPGHWFVAFEFQSFSHFSIPRSPSFTRSIFPLIFPPRCRSRLYLK